MLSFQLLSWVFSAVVALGQSSPAGAWNEIEAQITAKKVKLQTTEEEISQLNKQLSRPMAVEAKDKIKSDLKFLKDEKAELKKELEDLEQQINFRFPERGLKIQDSALKKEELEFKTKKSGELETKSVKPDAVEKTMDALRRQFGTRVDPAQVPKSLESGSPKGGSSNDSVDSIEKKIIISK